MQKNLVAGEWIDSPDVTENVSPANTDDKIGDFAKADANLVDEAVAAAKNAQPAWAAATPQVRHDVLDATSNLIAARKDDLGRLLAREEGKTLAEATGEVIRAAQIFKFFAGETLRITGDLLPSVRPQIDIEVTREPIGVVGAITPWNFPIAIPAWKAAPALAYGNSVVMKPADQTPASAHAMAEILVEAGAPAGVFNLVMGKGSVVGEAIVNHPDVDAVSFTGSLGTGRSIALKCVETQKKVQTEMGGKNPMIVLSDANLDVAVDAVLNGAFFSTGQRCTASSRIIVEAGIYDDFRQALAEKMQALRVGDPLDPATQIGPVIDAAQLAKNLEYIEIAKAEGANVIGGEALQQASGGYFMSPGLLCEANNQMRSSREEIFGPIASLIKVADFEEALITANDTEFGLSAGICTQSLAKAREFKRRAKAGMVMINLPTAGVDYHVPFGGIKGSSYGAREQGSYAKEFYTSVKTAYIG